MTAIDVISLPDAKDHLVVLNDDFYDKQITGIIKTAVAMIEKYTGHYFYQRTKQYPITSDRTAISDYPLEITGIVDGYGNPVSSFMVNINKGALDTYVRYWGFNECGYNQPFINAQVGYTTVDDIPQPLIGAAYKLITYLFQNKDAYSADLPADVQLILNSYRRDCNI